MRVRLSDQHAANFNQTRLRAQHVCVPIRVHLHACAHTLPPACMCMNAPHKSACTLTYACASARVAAFACRHACTHIHRTTRAWCRRCWIVGCWKVRLKDHLTTLEEHSSKRGHDWIVRWRCTDGLLVFPDAGQLHKPCGVLASSAGAQHARKRTRADTQTHARTQAHAPSTHARTNMRMHACMH